jgi:DNA polymerase I
MPRDQFLSYFADPFSMAEPVFAVAEIGGRPPRIATLSDLITSDGNVFTFQVEHLVEALRVRRLSLPPFVDIRQAMQLASGLPRRKFERSEWRFSELLRLTNLSTWEQESYLALLEGEKALPDRGSLENLLLRTCTAIADIWSGLSDELGRLGELERFLEFEIPVQQLFYKRQMAGLAVDVDKSQRFLAAAKSEKYAAMLKVGSALQHNPTGLNYWNVLPLLSPTDASNLMEFSTSRNLPSYFKMAANKSSFARDFRTMITANQNIKSLLSLVASDGRIYPSFDTMGSVTARIQTSSPNLQQLKSVYRGSLKADPGMHCAYFDYAQYEPGILAQLVGPGRYRDLYYSGDVYASLSESVFGDTSKRDTSKRIFIAFCYGMELDSIGRLLDGRSDRDGSSVYARSVREFFGQFTELTDYKLQCEDDLQRLGFISTRLGNRRVRGKTGRLRRRERGWAMNQVIQGTASLIFKDALLSLCRRFGVDAILLPVHDAIWLQVPTETMSSAEFQHTATEEMKTVFAKWCPDVRVRVKVSSFGGV